MGLLSRAHGLKRKHPSSAHAKHKAKKHAAHKAAKHIQHAGKSKHVKHARATHRAARHLASKAKHIARHAKHVTHNAIRHAKHPLTHANARHTSTHVMHPHTEGGAMLVSTELDAILKLVNEKRRLTLKEIARQTKLTPQKVELWCTRLQEHGLIDLDYPLLGKAVVRTKLALGAPTKKRGHKLLVMFFLLLIVVAGIAFLVWQYYNGVVKFPWGG